MESKEIELLIKILRETVYESLKNTQITLESTLKKDLMIDSITYYTLLVKLEKAFQITFRKVSIDSAEFETVGTLLAYIISLREEKRCFYTIMDKNSTKVFLYENDKAYTYEQLWDFVARARVYLQKMGVKEGQRIPIACKDFLHFIVGFLSMISLGACAVLIEIGKKNREILEILEQIESKCIVTDYLSEDTLSDNGIKKVEFSIVQLPEEKNEAVQLDMDSEGCIIYTSGSTSKPKGVIRSKRVLMEHSKMLQKTYRLSSDDTSLCLVQPQHAFGLENILAAIYSGVALRIQKDFSHTKVIECIKNGECTIVIAVPFQYNLLARVDVEVKKNQLRYLLSAGAPLNKETNIAINNLFGIPVTIIYGSSELGATAINLSNMEGFEYDSVGMLVPGVKIRICDGSKEISSKYQIGQITLDSPYRMMGYVQENEETRNSFTKDGWYISGDLGYLNENEFLFITGRKKNVMNIAGKKVSPEEVENVIKKLPAVKDVKVESQTTTLFGETIIAQVVKENGSDLSDQAILNHCKVHLSDYKIPRQIFFKNRLEYTRNGKLIR